MNGYGKQEFDDRNPSRRGYRKDINEEMVRRVASYTAWQIRKDQEKANQKLLRDFIMIAIAFVLGVAVGYHRARGVGF